MARKLHKRRTADSAEKLSLSQYLSSFSGPISFFLIVVAAIFFISTFFRVSHIEIEGNTHYTDNEIRRAIDIEEGDNLIFFDQFGTLSRVYAKLPYVEVVEIERSLPNKVILKVTESKALAYIMLGDEPWTLDHSCKVLGQATDEELGEMIYIKGIDPGTLYIGEPLTTADNDQQTVDLLAETLYQLEARGLYSRVESIDFTDPNAVEFQYDGKYLVRLGGPGDTEYKFGMLMSAMSQLLAADTGVIDVSDGQTAHFIPN